MADAALKSSDDELACCASVLAPGLFDGRVVVIAGGGSGIGRATAWLAARLGAQVVVCGRTAAKLSSVAAAIGARGYRCESAVLDIRDRTAVDAFFAGTLSRLGRIDLLINSVGGQFPQAAIDIAEKGWRAVIETNLHGGFHMLQAAAKHWRDRQLPGSIVTVVLSRRGLHQVSHSCAARAGIIAFCEAAAVEWAPLGIRVNCVAPGAIVSEGWQVYAEDVRRRYADTNPMRQAGYPWDIAQALLFIGGPGGRFITGQTLHVNGGGDLWGEIWTAGKPEYFVAATQTWQAPAQSRKD
jgi:citronellol/citronellal dehydrogenase